MPFINDRPWFWCRFENEAGVTTPQRSAVTPTITGSPLPFAAGKFGNALDMRTANYGSKFITLPFNNLFYWSPLTIEFWHMRKENFTTGVATLFYDSPLNGGDATHLQIRLQSSTGNYSTANFLLSIISGGGSRIHSYQWTTWSGLFPLDTWVHIGICFDHTQVNNIDKVSLFKNGVLYTTGKTYTPSGTPANALETMLTTNWQMGQTSAPMRGYVDNLKIYLKSKNRFDLSERGGMFDYSTPILIKN